jgi:hypothetical protein
MVKSNGYQSIPTKVSPAAWTTTTNRIFTTDSQPLTTVAASTLTSRDNSNLSSSLDISKKLDLILIKIDSLTGEYDNLKTNFINVNQQLKSCQENINLLKIFISEQICPLILEVGEGVMSKKKDVNKKKLGPLISNFNKGLESMTKSTESNSIQLSSSVLKKSSSYDSISEEF